MLEMRMIKLLILDFKWKNLIKEKFKKLNTTRILTIVSLITMDSTLPAVTAMDLYKLAVQIRIPAKMRYRLIAISRLTKDQFGHLLGLIQSTKMLLPRVVLINLSAFGKNKMGFGNKFTK